MASSSTASQEADEPNSSAVVVQQSRDSLELNESKGGNDGVSAMDFNSLNESDLSEQELQAVRRNRFMSQGADAVVGGSPPRLLQLSPIKEGADSPIFQRPPGKPVAPSGPDPSRDVSMELVSDLYADLATQDSQGVGEDHDDEAASEDAVLDESLEEESSLLAGLEDLEESDDADLSALFAVSGATAGALSQQEKEEEGEHSQIVAAAVAAHAPAQSTVSLAQIDVMQKDLLTTMSLLAQGNQQIEEAAMELQQEQANVAKEKQKNERLRVENLQLAEELALAKKELTATEKELAEASQLVQEQQKDLAKSALLIQELHKRLKQTRESPRHEHSEIVEDTTTLRLNRQLPAELLARKKRQRQQEAEPASKEARSDPAQRSPARTGAARAKAIAARAEMVALAASPSTAVLTSYEAAAAVVSAPSRASSAKNRQPRRPKPSATTLVRAGAQLHRPSPGPSPKRPSPRQPSSSGVNAQRSSTPALNIIAAKPRPPSAPASKRTLTAASPASRIEPRPPSAGAAGTQEAGRMAGMKRKSPASSPAPAPAPAPAKKAKLRSAKAKRMALFSQKYLVKK